MTEQKKETPAVVEQLPAEASATTSAAPESKNPGAKAGMALGIIAIILALAVGGGLYVWNKRENSAQLTSVTELTDRLNALTQQQNTRQTALTDVIKRQAGELKAARTQQAQTDKTLDELKEKVAAISGSNANTWLLAQADFLVKQAGRKLWSDNDAVTAAALLKSADTSLADMDDPSLIYARRAIAEDIAALSTVTQIDYDGIILKINLLANQIDNLRPNDNSADRVPVDSDSRPVSGAPGEWRVNLIRSWHNFLNNFLTIRRRDATDVPLLAPNQNIYLRENIRSRLLIAAQAVPRHQQEIYQQSLESVSTWVQAYYDTSDAATHAFLEDLKQLEQRNITMVLPDSLRSQPVLEKLMQTRVRSITDNTTAIHQPETPSVSSAQPLTPEAAQEE